MDVQASNLAKLTEVYNWRTEVEMRRENNVFQRGDFHTLKAINAPHLIWIFGKTTMGLVG